MSDTLSGFLGLVLIAGLFVAYAMERRARALAKTRAQQPGPVRVDAGAAEIAPVSTADREGAAVLENAVPSSSPNWGMPIVYCLLLVGMDSHRVNFWGYLWQGLYFVMFVFAAYSTFSPRELAAEQVRRPGTTRLSHYVTLGVPYVLFPAAGWILVMPLGWAAGVLVPVLPWAVLLVVAGVVHLIPKKRAP